MFCLINLIYGVYSGSGARSAEHHFAILYVRNKLLENESNHVIRAIEKYESVRQETRSDRESIKAFILALREPFPQSLSYESPPTENEDVKPENGDLDYPPEQK